MGLPFRQEDTLQMFITSHPEISAAKLQTREPSRRKTNRSESPLSFTAPSQLPVLPRRAFAPSSPRSLLSRLRTFRAARTLRAGAKAWLRSFFPSEVPYT